MIVSSDFDRMLSMNTIGERIRYIRKSSGVSQEDFAKRLDGVTRGAVGNWETGKPISRENLQAIASKWGVSLDWLAEGKGPKPDPDDLIANEVFREPIARARPFTTYDPDAEWKPEPEFEGEAYTREEWVPGTPGAMPEIDLKLGAGEGTVGEVLVLEINGNAYSGHRIVREWNFPPDFLHSSGTSLNQSIVGEVIGDSMLPNYLPADKVVIDLAQNTFTADGVYMWSDGFSPPQMKRLQRVPFTNPPRVKITSDNPMYEPYEADIADVKIFGKITWHLGRR